MLKKSIYYLILSLFISTGTLVSARDNQNSPVKTRRAKPIPTENFKHSDIGNPAINGTAKISEDGFDITAGGADIWGIKDEFNFIYVERTGDFDIVTRIESLSAPHLYTKAGLMAREDLTAGSRHIYFQVFPNNNPRNKNNGGYEFQYRQLKDSEMKAIYPISAEGTPEFPVSYPNTWVRLQRVKNDFTGYYSTDGRNWKLYTTYSLELPAKIFLGIAVTSHNKSEATSAKFRKTGEIKH
jgi:hypothetical protein